jgi:hypothetical protein
VAEELTELALKLASEGFDEHVDALIAEARKDGTRLALAAAELATDGPARTGSLDQIAYFLLVEAFHKASGAREQPRSLEVADPVPTPVSGAYPLSRATSPA